jgi:hypothetical protein
VNGGETAARREDDGMKYMLLIYGDAMQAQDAGPEEQAAELQRWADYTGWLQQQGWMLAGDPLQDVEHATTVRIRNGETLTTDGPFAETKEQLGGYYLLECENLDQAIEAAKRCPGAANGSIEVRPLMDFDMPEAT